jgi:hypothetical protein
MTPSEMVKRAQKEGIGIRKGYLFLWTTIRKEAKRELRSVFKTSA